MFRTMEYTRAVDIQGRTYHLLEKYFQEWAVQFVCVDCGEKIEPRWNDPIRCGCGAWWVLFGVALYRVEPGALQLAVAACVQLQNEPRAMLCS